MIKLIGIHELTPLPTVERHDVEQFIRNELSYLPALPGKRIRFLKGGQGRHQGTYLMLVEMDQTTRGDWSNPSPVGNARELERWLSNHAPSWTQFGKIARIQWADYVVLGT
jgi:hypothetical protein